MKESSAINKLMGFPISKIGYAGLLWIQFGNLTTSISPVSKTERQIGEIALHLPENWEIWSTENNFSSKDFNREILNIFNNKLALNPHRVSQIIYGEKNIELLFSDDLRIKFDRVSDSKGEAWRLIDFHSHKHFTNLEER